MSDSASKYLFFFSYARKNVDRAGQLKRFYDDLKEEVVQLAKIEEDVYLKQDISQSPEDDDEDAFFDTKTLEVGEDWKDKLLSGLQGSRCFVCLCSTKYFLAGYCGREFGFFRKRIESYVSANPRAPKPPLIIPVLWDAEKYVKSQSAVAQLQYDTDALPDDYAVLGLRQFMNTQSEKDYRKIVGEIAQRIKERIEKYTLPPLTPAPKIDALESPFGMPDVTHQAVAKGDGQSTAGEAVRFVLAVGRRYELAQNPTPGDWAGYDDEPWLWKPFHPREKAKKIGQITLAAAVNENLSDTALISVTNHLKAHIETEVDKGHIVIAVIDPCSLGLDQIREAARSIDTLGRANLGILVTKNDAVPGIDAYQAIVEETFKNNIQSRLDREYVPDLSSEEQLSDRLAKMIARLQAFVTGTPSVTPGEEMAAAKSSSDDAAPQI